jgi:hypothetical protein
MKAIIKPLFPNTRGRSAAARIGLRRSPVAQAMDPTQRHQRWSTGVVTKYGLNAGSPGWCFESLVHLMNGRMRIALNQTFGPRIQFHTHSATQNVFHRGYSEPMEQVLQDRTITRYVPLRVDSSARKEASAAPQPLGAPAPGNELERAFLNKKNGERNSGTETRSFWPAMSRTLLLAERVFTKTVRSRFEVITNEQGPAESAQRIERKVRRVDSGLRPVPQDFVMSPAKAAARANTVKAIRNRAPSTMKAEVESGKPSAPPAPAFDVTRIADEVMRQLDRRVVAARERFGKI